MSNTRSRLKSESCENIKVLLDKFPDISLNKSR